MKIYQPEGWALESLRNRHMTSSPSTLYDAMQKGEILEAKATMCDFDHNLIVDLGCMKGIIPREEGTIGISEGKVKDIALISRVGKAVCFIIEEIKPDKNGKLSARLSRRKAQELCRDNYISKLSCGDIIDAKITHLESFGAFCDIGCVIASLLPIDSISVSRISHPCDRFSPGDKIRAVIKSIENGRITLSQKELLGSWEQNASMFKQGETVSGIIRSVEDYGIFVELLPNLAGLAEPREGARPGQMASVYIKSIIPDKMKIKLIIIDTFDRKEESKNSKYFFKGDHIDRWDYSPINADKLICSVF